MLNMMLKNSDITMEELNRILNGVKVEYEIEYQEVPILTGVDFESGLTASEGAMIKIPISIKPKGGYTYSSPLSDWTPNNWENKSGGGSSSGPSEYKSTSKDEVLDRYKEEDDRLDDINDALDDYNRLMDRSYGQGRLNQMAKLRKALDEEKKAIEAKKAKALEYL